MSACSGMYDHALELPQIFCVGWDPDLSGRHDHELAFASLLGLFEVLTSFTCRVLDCFSFRLGRPDKLGVLERGYVFYDS
ncbi:hypothetical protein PF010_g23070 [Phytophthora fragariae]|uniref:Uncharacterized protein n=1 Tax=Phytophthora fragariae TaxID=53985 RepID=A0A6G0K798_9STRA|nr:hypothetical protein PF010_g23070 [Phytophthora fragariae]